MVRPAEGLPVDDWDGGGWIDTPSVDLFTSTDLAAHHALIERQMTWIEGLLLDGVEAGCFLLIALPMPLEGCEAAPIRALIRDL